ncbi:F-box domain [Macleaya cordata]|uniref:F-box domain n=1 Tax=Macleaya cordata TaxID=56857 RepID=A0A200QAU4_MACCD|nr:F-box domain [Macleaya cordata]
MTTVKDLESQVSTLTTELTNLTTNIQALLRDRQEDRIIQTEILQTLRALAENWSAQPQQPQHAAPLPLPHDAPNMQPAVHLQGDAIPWYRWIKQSLGLLTWPQFSRALCSRFGSRQHIDPCSCLSKLSQSGSQEDNNNNNPWNKLDDVMVETLLARLPTIEILRCQFVCKRWRSIIHCSTTFSITSNQLFNPRGPWFFMFNSSSSSSTCVVYDMEVSDWRHVHLQLPTTPYQEDEFIITRPVASGGGLICFSSSGTDYYSFILKNPLTGVSYSLPTVKTYGQRRGMAMHVSKSESGSGSNYKIFVVFGDWHALFLQVFSLSEEEEEEEEEDHQEAANWKELLPREVAIDFDAPWWPYNAIEWNVAVDEMVGVTTLGNEGQILVHYLNKIIGILICFDTLKGTFFTSPRLVTYPQLMDLVECGGRVFTVILIKEYKYTTLYIWEFDYEKAECWKLITDMPLKWWKGTEVLAQGYHYIQEDYTDFKFDLNCSGHGDYIMVCLNCSCLIDIGHLNHIQMYNIKENTWAELPQCLDPDDSTRIWFAPYCFEPKIGAKV